MKDTNINNSCFFTGHRFISGSDSKLLIPEVKRICIDLIEKKGVNTFINGGALGFDMLSAELILELKKEYNISLHMYLPCIDQSNKWQTADIKRWKDILRRSDDFIFITHTPYTKGCMQLRNRAMVEAAQFGIAFCKHRFGGTYSTVAYAQRLGRQLILLPSKNSLSTP